MRSAVLGSDRNISREKLESQSLRRGGCKVLEKLLESQMLFSSVVVDLR